MSGQFEWFYEANGERLGPVTLEMLRAQFRANEIGPATLVWSPRFGQEWKQATQTEVAAELCPPPLPIVQSQVPEATDQSKSSLSPTDKVAITAAIFAAVPTIALYLWWPTLHWAVYLIVFLFVFVPVLNGMMEGVALRRVVDKDLH